MKRFVLILLATTSFILCSCSTSQKFTVRATPGTQIIHPKNNQILAVANSEGLANVVMEDDDYSSFLLTKSPGATQLTPFALDYSKRNRAGLGAGLYSSILLCSSAGVLFLLGSIMGDKTNLYISGAVALTSGFGLFLLSGNASEADKWKYGFKIIDQRGNQDISFVSPDIQVVPRSVPTSSTQSPSAVQTEQTPGTESSKHSIGEKSKKSLNNYASKVKGEYVCSGSLSKNGTKIETYSYITVKITEKGKDQVSVNVIEANGESFFNKESQYSIKKQKDGSFLLTNEAVESATITIKANGTLNYAHPKVIIEGEIYKLSINGQLKK